MKSIIRTIRNVFLSGVSFANYDDDLYSDKYTDIIEALGDTLSETEKIRLTKWNFPRKQCVIDEVGKAGFVIGFYGKTYNKTVIFFTYEDDDALTPTISNIGVIDFINGIAIKPVIRDYEVIKSNKLEDLCNTFGEMFIEWFDCIADYLITNKKCFSINRKVKYYQETLKHAKSDIQNIKSNIFIYGSLHTDGYVYYDKHFILLPDDDHLPIKEIEVDTPKTNEPEKVEKVIKSPKYPIEYEIKPITTYRKINEVAKKLSNEIDFNVSNNIAKRTCYTMTFKNDINGDLGRFRDPIIFKISNKGFKYLKVLFDSNKYPANSYIFKTKNKEIKIKIDGKDVHLIWAHNDKATEKGVTVRREEKILNLIFELFGLLNVRVGCKR